MPLLYGCQNNNKNENPFLTIKTRTVGMVSEREREEERKRERRKNESESKNVTNTQPYRIDSIAPNNGTERTDERQGNERVGWRLSTEDRDEIEEKELISQYIMFFFLGARVKVVTPCVSNSFENHLGPEQKWQGC